MIFVIGFPGYLGGADTELWHTLQLWRGAGIDVTLVPTWSADPEWRSRVQRIGCSICSTTPANLDSVPGLAGATVVSFCNGEFLKVAATLRGLGCRLVWANCMTWMFPAERAFCKAHGVFDAYLFQSEFQRAELERELIPLKYAPEQGHVIRGAFDNSEWHFSPRPHTVGSPFTIGRIARPDADKWSSNTWPIYGRIQYREKRALMLGMDEKVHKKLGSPPSWADCLKPMALPAKDYFKQIHCLLPVNGGARENWPRAGLEAMAAGVPVVAQNDWGWREMIVHGETGFLGSCDEELAHWAAVLAYDEPLRLRIAAAARERLVAELANNERILAAWLYLFDSINSAAEVAA